MTGPTHAAAWYMLDRCNFRCDYCPLPSPEPDRWREHLIVDPADLARRFDGTGLTWAIVLTGGEPFLYEGFIDVCAALTENHWIGIDSNLSLNSEALEFSERIDPQRVAYVFTSVHIEERTRRGLLDEYVGTVKMLEEKGFNVLVNYVLHPRLLDRFERDVEYFAERGIELIPKPYRGRHGLQRYPYAYTAEEWKMLERLNSELEIMIPFYSRGLRCHAGQTLIAIWQDGTASRCLADETPIGDIQNGFELEAGPEPCRITRCSGYGTRYLAEDKHGRVGATLLSLREKAEYVRDFALGRKAPA